MFSWLKSFLFDEATFLRVMSDAATFIGLLASLPPAQALLMALAPGSEWAGPVIALLAGTYSARARQVTPPPSP